MIRAPAFSRRSLVGGGAVVGLALLAPALTRAKPATFPVVLSDAEWRQRLSPSAYAVLRRAAAERPFSSPLNAEHRRGTFACAGCGQPLFLSTIKFDSGTGWPSFWKPMPGAVGERRDRSLMMERVEVLCARCGGHLGHVFEDGPKPTSLRYCMNGAAMTFKPA
ncbi:peptide-methionine (R)-S-oxide reductase MsrB [Sphingomonas sp. ID0503]|uniref:peptide-methionine (R)-S-oxide reductase MsrB n=1 Tax=Sphingomonas sp. ID0503 TaxID=3399691 RepID=UPI003AFA8F76